MKAAELPGHAPLAVAVVLGLEADGWPAGRLPLPRGALRKAGLDRFGARRGLLELERAGLVEVVRDGASVVVRLLDGRECQENTEPPVQSRPEPPERLSPRKSSPVERPTRRTERLATSPAAPSAASSRGTSGRPVPVERVARIDLFDIDTSVGEAAP